MLSVTEKVELVNMRIEKLHFKSRKFYPLIPRKVQESACQRMLYSRECYKPESGMIHLESSSLGESSQLKVHCGMNSRGTTPFPLSPDTARIWLQMAVGLEGVSLAWIGSGSPATQEN